MCAACAVCDKLTSLKGLPKQIVGDLFCYDCGKIFTSKDVTEISDVRGLTYFT